MATNTKREFRLRSHPLLPIDEPASERLELTIIVIFMSGLFWGWVLF